MVPRGALRVSQQGYSLLELIIAMMIIMMLVVNILPRYLRLYHDAKDLALTTMASTLSTISSVNYIKSTYQSGSWFKVTNCKDVKQGLDEPMPSTYRIVSMSIAVGQNVSCTLTDEDKRVAQFIAVGTK